MRLNVRLTLISFVCLFMFITVVLSGLHVTLKFLIHRLGGDKKALNVL